jgi:DNA-binding MarR family transcriptional regulator
MNSKVQLPNSILFHFGMVNKALFNRANKLISKGGFPIQLEQLPVVLVLYYEGDQSQQEIADSCERDKSSVQRSISSLLKHEIVQVAQDPHDKRRNIVHLTPKGKAIAKEIEQEIIRIEDKLFGQLSRKEKDAFIKQLAHIHAIIDSYEE